LRVSRVGERGELYGMASKVCMDKGMCKSWTADDPDYPDQQICKPKTKERKLHVECTSGLGR